ncbi:MAG: hypothetical protein ABJ242_05545 [Marinomonas sp.]
MATVNLQSDNAAARLRAGVGLAGMFVVACFGAALFFTVEQTQAAETNLTAGSSNGVSAQIAQVSEAK